MQGCPYCTRKIRNNANYCPYCGHDLRFPVNPAFQSRYFEQVTGLVGSRKKRHIGFLGLLTLLVGVALTCTYSPDGQINLLVGLVDLLGIGMVIYGIATGSI